MNITKKTPTPDWIYDPEFVDTEETLIPEDCLLCYYWNNFGCSRIPSCKLGEFGFYYEKLYGRLS